MGRRDDNELDLMLSAVDIDLDREDLAVDRATLRLLIRIGREIRQMEDSIVANLEGVNTALTQLSQQITQIGEQVAALQADSVTQAQLDQVAADITAAADQVDSIIETADETAAETPAETPETPPA